MTTEEAIFVVQHEGDTLVLSLHADLREGLFWEIEHEAKPILDEFQDPALKNVVLDFAGTDLFGSSALGLFIRLDKRVKTRHGRMALCNLSEHQREILQVTKLDRLWPVHANRAEALRAVRGWEEEQLES
jgi:anti-anti-sigma factor